jgi:hypothetical protein
MTSPSINKKLVCYQLKGIAQKGLNCDYYVQINYTRNQSVVLERVDFGLKLEELGKNILLADIFIEIYCNSWKGNKRIARINYNLYFNNS